MISRTTAWLIACVIVLSQLVLTQWTLRGAADTTLVNYVSFSGTVVSIILAVLAIVYSYYSTFAQKIDSNNISSQIAILTETVKSIDASEARFSDELNRISKVSAQLEDLREHSRLQSDHYAEIRRVVSDIDSKIAAKQQLVSADGAPKRAAPTKDVTPSTEQLIANILSSATEEQTLLFAVLCASHKQKTTIFRAYKEFLEPIVVDTASDFKKGSIFGELFAYSMVMIDLAGEQDITEEDFSGKAMPATIAHLKEQRLEGFSADFDKEGLANVVKRLALVSDKKSE